MVDNMKKCLKILLYMIIIEAILGGAGRFFAVGNLSIRMALYGAAFFVYILCLIIDRKNITISFKSIDINLMLIILFWIWIVFSAANGYFVSKNGLSQIVGDITGFASLILIFPFTYAFRNKRDVDIVTMIVAVSVIIQAFVILLIHYGLGMGILNFDGLNSLLQRLYIGNMARIVPDSIRIFFKSSIYLQVGFLILLSMVVKEVSRKRQIILYISLIIVSYALILSFTRGFWLPAFVTTAVYIIFKGIKRFIKPVAIILGGIVLMMGITSLVYGNINVAYSIAARTGIIHIKQDAATNEITTVSTDDVTDMSLQYRDKLKKAMFVQIKRNPVLGNGFGVVLKEIGQQESHSEYMFYDIWMEMGLIGLVIYISMFIVLIIKYLNIRKTRLNISELRFIDEHIVAMAGVVLASTTNPFLNNPIGITYLIIVICSINIYMKKSISA